VERDVIVELRKRTREPDKDGTRFTSRHVALLDPAQWQWLQIGALGTGYAMPSTGEICSDGRLNVKLRCVEIASKATPTCHRILFYIVWPIFVDAAYVFRSPIDLVLAIHLM
jgi:hypothetical protein